MPDVRDDRPIRSITAAEITDEIWLEAARSHAGVAPLRDAVDRARIATTPPDGPARSGTALPLLALLDLDGVEFAEAAAMTLLGRAAHEAELASMVAQLAQGRSKVELLGALQRGGEARRSGRAIAGLGRRYLAHRLYRLPVLGSAASFTAAVLRRTGVSRLLGDSHPLAIGRRRRALERRVAEQQAAIDLLTRRLAGVQAAQDDAGRKAARDQARLSKQSAKLGRRFVPTEDGMIDSLLALRESVYGQEARLAGIEGAAGALRSELEGRVAAAEAAATQNRRDIADQQRRIGLMLNSLNAVKALGHAVPDSVDAQDDHALDALYVAFEDRFRGTRGDIKERQRVYLPRLRAAGAGAAERPILDIGAGRGEFLELMAEAGLAASGVDSNVTMARLCRDTGLDCTEGDALAYLGARPAASLGAVTGFHIIEHLPFKTVVRIIDEALRALAPGGLLILETPNPANLLTASRYFYMDPTHRNPLPAEMMAMIAEARGFPNPEIIELHPMTARFPGADGLLGAALDQVFHGPQDYALVARKA